MYAILLITGTITLNLIYVKLYAAEPMLVQLMMYATNLLNVKTRDVSLVTLTLLNNLLALNVLSLIVITHSLKTDVNMMIGQYAAQKIKFIIQLQVIAKL